jgi:hypothetical protein
MTATIWCLRNETSGSSTEVGRCQASKR